MDSSPITQGASNFLAPKKESRTDMLRVVVVVVVDLTMVLPEEVEKADTNEVAGALVEERAADAKRRNDWRVMMIINL